MSIEIRPALVSDKEALSNLMQFYIYDFSQFMDCLVEEDGRYGEYPYLKEYWQEPDRRFPFLIQLDGKHAGFVFVRRIEDEAGSYYSIAEFFVMKIYRRSGIGRKAAHEIFRSFKGNWQVFQIEKNVPAQAFWREVIGEFTDDRYTENSKDGRITQSFCSGE